MAGATLQNLTAYALQIALVTALAALLLRIVPVASAGFRYAYWRIVLAAALIAPWLLRTAPRAPEAVEGALTTATGPMAPAMSSPIPALAGSAVEWVAVLPWVLAAGIVVRVLWVAIGISRLRRLRRAGTPVVDPMYQELQQLRGTHADMLAVPGLVQPVTFGVWRPVVLLPEEFDRVPDAIRRAAVTHELFHVQRRDWLAVMVEEAVRAIFWFHPAMWWMTGRIQQSREEFIDHLAVLAIGSRRDYMEALLAFADGPSLAPAPAFARRPHLFHRIVLLSKETVMSSRRVVISAAALAALLVTGGWYASEAFPVEQGASPFAPAGASARPAQTPGMPVEQLQPITPENPIPRRVLATPIPYPSELAGSGYSAAVSLRVIVDASGAVASVSRGAVAISNGEAGARAERAAMDVFVDTAADAIKQWRYAPPFKAPIAFFVGATFAAESAAVTSQNEIGNGVIANGREARLATPAELARNLESMRAVRVQAPGTSPASDSPVRIGGAVRQPIQLRKINPVYPPIALSARVQGVVILEVSLGADGLVTDARVLRSIPLLDQAALDAVRQWQYQPTLLNGVPTPIVMTVTVPFTLPESPQF
jgi:TonB family protein